MRKKTTLNSMNESALQLVAERFKALGELSRLRLLVSLLEKERTVGELVETTGLNQANVSRHLQVLLREGIVARRKEGLCVHYHVSDQSIPQLCDLMCGGLRSHLSGQSQAIMESSIKGTRRGHK